MSNPLLLVALVWLAIVAIGAVLLRRYVAGRALRERLFAEPTADVDEMVRDERGGFLGRWLFVAGYRSPAAVPLFLSATLLLAATSGAVVWGFYRIGAVDDLARLLTALPGGIGEVFLPFAYLSPWIAACVLTAIPAVVVRAARRSRVQSIEQDLPLTLDLLATLAQAGLGFDIALEKILATQDSRRPLVREFRTFQYDLLAGRTRVEALRRLSRRLEVSWFSIFVSALVQAEQLGASLAETLATQAQDLRERRRERAMAFAMAVPVKLLFPLIVCFLPGLMAAALGPTSYQIVQTLDAFLTPIGGAAPGPAAPSGPAGAQP